MVFIPRPAEEVIAEGGTPLTVEYRRFKRPSGALPHCPRCNSVWIRPAKTVLSGPMMQKCDDCHSLFPAITTNWR